MLAFAPSLPCRVRDNSKVYMRQCSLCGNAPISSKLACAIPFARRHRWPFAIHPVMAEQDGCHGRRAHDHVHEVRLTSGTCLQHISSQAAGIPRSVAIPQLASLLTQPAASRATIDRLTLLVTVLR